MFSTWLPEVKERCEAAEDEGNEGAEPPPPANGGSLLGCMATEQKQKKRVPESGTCLPCFFDPRNAKKCTSVKMQVPSTANIHVPSTAERHVCRMETCLNFRIVKTITKSIVLPINLPPQCFNPMTSSLHASKREFKTTSKR